MMQGSLLSLLLVLVAADSSEGGMTETEKKRSHAQRKRCIHITHTFDKYDGDDGDDVRKKLDTDVGICACFMMYMLYKMNDI